MKKLLESINTTDSTSPIALKDSLASFSGVIIVVVSSFGCSILSSQERNKKTTQRIRMDILPNLMFIFLTPLSSTLIYHTFLFIMVKLCI